MQVDEALSGMAGRAVRQHDIAVETTDPDTQNTARIAGKFDDGLPAAQGAVEAKNDALEPRMPTFVPRRRDEFQSSRSEHVIRDGHLIPMIQSISLL
ncbi:MAG: hypothetical protein E6G78_13935 [Alphaproteobacteria bacterium]|nr:MAG: hypothetical protein E6G78_13935 [Alphaproteobacteria bacterium]